MSSEGEHGGGLDPLFHAKLRAAGGLAHLAEGRYAEAARSFTSVSTELTGQFSSVVSAEDIALYAANMECVTNVDARAGSMVICTQPPAIPVCQCSTVLALVY